MSKKKVSIGTCKVPGCGREAKVKAGLCHACYNTMWNWMRRTPTAVMQRQHQLYVWQNRMEMLTPANVRSFAKAKRRHG